MLTLPFPRNLKSWWHRVNASRRALPQARLWAGGIALVSREEVLVKGDLLSICAAIRELKPGFACGAATVTAFDAVMKEHPEYAPRMVVNLHPLNGACAGPWAVFSGSSLTKSDELAVLDQARLPVPRWQLLSPGDKVNERDFGPYVVVKPDDGLRGACVRVCKTRQVKSDPIFVTVNQKTSAPLVQAYIHTGPRAVSHRVGVLFGRVIYRWKLTAREIPGRELPADGDFRSKSGATVVSSGKGSVFPDVLEPDVVDLAERAAAALPDVPLLGVDIVRRQSDGQLFIIELNSSGYCFRQWRNGVKRQQRAQPAFGLRQFLCRSATRSNGVASAALKIRYPTSNRHPFPEMGMIPAAQGPSAYWAVSNSWKFGARRISSIAAPGASLMETASKRNSKIGTDRVIGVGVHTLAFSHSCLA